MKNMIRKDLYSCGATLKQANRKKLPKLVSPLSLVIVERSMGNIWRDVLQLMKFTIRFKRNTPDTLHEGCVPGLI